jgi:5-formyltetrahydrofolate cyclo-ligase
MNEDAEKALYLRAKTELRKRLRALRATTPASACAERSTRIVTRLESLAQIVEAKSVALFWPIVARHEVDLRPLDQSLRARGVTIAYPAIDPETRDMTFRTTSAREDLEERGFGFEEPSRDAPIAPSLDVIVVPAIAVEPRGHRLGYGAGFYDRALPNWPHAFTVVVAFDFQLLVELPITETDFAVDWIVTDSRSFQAEKPG